MTYDEFQLNKTQFKHDRDFFFWHFQIEVMYEDEPLKDYYTLMDIAYIYTWRRVRGILYSFAMLWSYSLLIVVLFCLLF